MENRRDTRLDRLVQALKSTDKIHLEEQNIARKRRLGHFAAALSEPGDRVFFDCGTTMPWVIDLIDLHLEFTATVIESDAVTERCRIY